MLNKIAKKKGIAKPTITNNTNSVFTISVVKDVIPINGSTTGTVLLLTKAPGSSTLLPGTGRSLTYSVLPIEVTVNGDDAIGNIGAASFTISSTNYEGFATITITEGTNNETGTQIVQFKNED